MGDQLGAMKQVRTYALEGIVMAGVRATFVGKVLLIFPARKPRRCTSVEMVDVEVSIDDFENVATSEALRFTFEDGYTCDTGFTDEIKIIGGA